MTSLQWLQEGPCLSPARSRLPILECPQPLLLLAVQAAGAHRQTAAADSITRLEAQAVHSHVELGGTLLDGGAGAASCWQRQTIYIACKLLASSMCAIGRHSGEQGSWCRFLLATIQWSHTMPVLCNEQGSQHSMFEDTVRSQLGCVRMQPQKSSSPCTPSLS